MCIAVQYVYQCYSCHSTVVKDLHHGPRYPCPYAVASGCGPGGGDSSSSVSLLGCCPSGLVWTSQRRRCCDDIDPRAAVNLQGGDEYRYFLLRSEKLCLLCEVQYEMRHLGIHAESEVLDIPPPPPSVAATLPPSSPSPSSAEGSKATVAGQSCPRYWGEPDHCHRRYRRRQGQSARYLSRRRQKVKCDVSPGSDDSEDEEEGGALL